MSNAHEISDLLDAITKDVRTIVAGEIALAKAEIKPVVRKAGWGAGLVGAGGYFVICATIILWFLFAAGFAWIYAGTSISGWAAAFFGMLTAFVLLLVAAGIIGLLGAKKLSGIRGPALIGDSLTETLASMRSGVVAGVDMVNAEVNPEPTPVVIEPETLAFSQESSVPHQKR